MPIPRLALRARRHRSRLPAGLAAAVTAVLLATAAAASAATPHHAAGPVVAAPAARSSAAVAPRLTTDTDAGCNTTVPRGYARCFAVIRTPADHLVTADADGPPAGSLGPADIRSAYDLPSGGGGQTVAIVDAFGDSHAESDLAAFRSHYGLPACTTANGCFRKVDQTGGTAYPADDPGWGGETSLDLDAVSSACRPATSCSSRRTTTTPATSPMRRPKASRSAPGSSPTPTAPRSSPASSPATPTTTTPASW